MGGATEAGGRKGGHGHVLVSRVFSLMVPSDLDVQSLIVAV